MPGDFVGGFYKCMNLWKNCIYDQLLEFCNTVVFLLFSKGYIFLNVLCMC